MPTMSKIYGVKSNAARAAAAYKLTRTDLVAVSGGWCFPMPELNPEMAADLAAEVHGRDLTNEECAEIARTEPDPNEPDVPDARAAHTVVNGRPNGEPYVDPIGGADWIEPAPSLERLDASSYASKRVFNGTRKPKHLPKAAKAPKPTQTVVNGGVEFTLYTVPTDVTTLPPDDPNMAAHTFAKPARQRREKAADKPKPAKRTKAPRPVVDGATKRGTKAYTDKMAARRRAGMNKRGITELVIKEIRTRWTPTSALLKMTGWQPTTLRGVLSLYAKKEGIEIKGDTRDGERYYYVAR